MLTELAGPFSFGLLAFTMLLAANEILNIGKLVSDDHAPLWAALEVFLWSLPGEIVLVIPMAMLLGTLLTLQRLSGESEVIAMKAGGIQLGRIVAPLLVAGFAMSLVTLVLQEQVAPFAQNRITDIEQDVINRASAFNRDLTVTAPLPGGGRQTTLATGYDRNTQALLNVTLVQYDAKNVPILVAFAARANFLAQQWTLDDVSTYRFNADGTVTEQPHTPRLEIQLGETPTDIIQRIKHDNPQEMSAAEISQIIRSGQLTQNEVRKYVTAFQEKWARPFACFVFVLIAVPFGIGPVRGGGSMGLGFGLAVAIVFVYYVVATIFSYISDALPEFAGLAAWMPNILFSALGMYRLRATGNVG